MKGLKKLQNIVSLTLAAMLIVVGVGQIAFAEGGVEHSLKDGLYELEVETLKEKSDDQSMAGTYLDKKVKFDTKDGKSHITMTIYKSDWMKNINVIVDGEDTPYEIVDKKENVEVKQVPFLSGDDSIGDISTIKFEVSSIDSEISLQMNVKPMGDSRVTFRVVHKKDTFKLIEEYKEDKKDETDKKDQVSKNETLRNGLYSIQIEVLKAKLDEPSMAGTYIEKNTKIESKGGKNYMLLTFYKSDWMKDIKLTIDGKNVPYEIVDKKENVEVEQVPFLTGEDKIGNITTIKFELPNVDSEINVKGNSVLMGNAEVEYRVILEKDTLKLIEEYKVDKEDVVDKKDNVVKEDETVKENERNKKDELNKEDKVVKKDKTNKVSKSGNEFELVKESELAKEDGGAKTEAKPLPKTGSSANANILGIVGIAISGLGFFLMKRK
ncbi:MAG: NEAT domain-containing protein [Clostridiaceae bacterium]|nr:NEAT domain-containing protein [Clostridiaceae bacterium]MBW4859262.1 NEAT domain-containing protein [Clostridiaceae bacterium]MBW4868719.1 NEAT domain-containing protein [Clostridiaceae bacterium]